MDNVRGDLQFLYQSICLKKLLKIQVFDKNETGYILAKTVNFSCVILRIANLKFKFFKLTGNFIIFK